MIIIKECVEYHEKVFILLVAFFAITSCLNSNDWEKDFTGTWDLVGIAEMNWHSIEKMKNYELAEAFENRISSDTER